MEQVRGLFGGGSAQNALSLEAGDSPLGVGALPGEGGSQARHRPAAIEDQDRLAMADLIDEGAELVFGFG